METNQNVTNIRTKNPHALAWGVCQIPNVLKYAEMPDIAGLIAPRALFAESGTEDTIFPVDATRFAVERARSIYKHFKAEDNLGLEVFEAGHSFYGVGAFEFLKKVL